MNVEGERVGGGKSGGWNGLDCTPRRIATVVWRWRRELAVEAAWQTFGQGFKV